MSTQLVYHELFLVDVHPVWLWRELEFWQKVREIQNQPGRSDFHGIRKLASLYIDKYCDFIEQRASDPWRPATFGPGNESQWGYEGTVI